MEAYRKQDLMSFLDYAEGRSLMPRNTVGSYKAACNAVLSAPEDEEEDLSTTDMDTLFHRFTIKNQMKVKPATLQSYKTRFANLTKEYIAYIENPSSWKPSAAQRSSSPTRPSRRATRSAESAGNDGGTQLRTQGGQGDSPAIAQQIVHQFPLRNDVIVQVTGIPFDVKRGEMARLTAFLSNLVAQEDERATHPQMLPEPEQLDG